ncbi:hypothetical protein [Streptomyces montanisoli]|uniref:Uncharacterized protein n=1 Tax=Streptomyces montanisoli TaxID=2798581 RepID=A0A940MG52_9ACTN|nr:hypothetical protein [Streptomyces montanisoli]MBP0460472.1 hypothetical protein [Streptomyces montanisoli]
MLTSDQNVPQPGESPDMPEVKLACPRATKNVRLRLGAEAQLDFPPVLNGIDYLLSVVTHLQPDTGGTPRDLKYAVLHLQAAAEVLLKARLIREHWSLVFRDLDTATHESFLQASFDSCTTATAVKRLRNIAGVTISEKDARALKDLAETRNALQHYGLTHNARALEARAAKVLDFLLGFLAEEALIPAASEHEADAWAHAAEYDLDMVRDGVTAIQSFVTRRMNRLRGNELKDAEDRTVYCLACQQPALLLGDDDGGGICHFCTGRWPARDLIEVYGIEAGWDSPGRYCPNCSCPTLIDGMSFADGKDTLYCTSCHTRPVPADLGRCNGCGRHWPTNAAHPDTGQILCPKCQGKSAEKKTRSTSH